MTTVDSSAAAAQRKKLLAAILLGLVFLAVVGLRMGGSADSDSTTAELLPEVSQEAARGPADTARPARRGLPDSSAASALAKEQEPLKLPEVDLSSILVRNPFRGERAATGSAPAKTANSASDKLLLDQFPSLFSSMIERLSATVNEPTNSAATPPPDQPPNRTEMVVKDAAPAKEGMPPVMAIITGGGRPVALIGDKFYHEQDIVNDQWQIVAIQAHGLTLRPLEPNRPSGGASQP